MFKNIKENIIKKYNERKEIIKDFIIDENSVSYIKKDYGLEEYLTPTKWQQYQNGKITRDQAVKFACDRAIKQLNKECNLKIEELKNAEHAPELEFLTIVIDKYRNYMWGWNASATIKTNNGIFKGHTPIASCRYDKVSTAVAIACNKDLSIKKFLCQIDDQLTIGDNEKFYGINKSLTFGSVPHFEGGVGMRCYLNIFEENNFNVECHCDTKKQEIYIITRK